MLPGSHGASGIYDRPPRGGVTRPGRAEVTDRVVLLVLLLSLL